MATVLRMRFTVIEYENYSVRLEDGVVLAQIPRQQIMGSSFEGFLELVYENMLPQEEGFVDGVPRPITLMTIINRADDDIDIYVPFVADGGVEAPWFALPRIWEQIRHGVDLVVVHNVSGPPDFLVGIHNLDDEEDEGEAEAHEVEQHEDVDNLEEPEEDDAGEEPMEDDAEDLGEEDDADEGYEAEDLGEEEDDEEYDDSEEDSMDVEEHENGDIAEAHEVEQHQDVDNVEEAEEDDAGEEPMEEEYDPDATESSSSG